MYPFFKFASVLLKAKFREKIKTSDKSVLKFRVGLTDIDLFMEMNNARYLTYMELGRWDYSSRVSFLSVMRKKKWGVTAGGTNIRYRRRIPLFTRFSVTTKLVCRDDRWFYFLQEFFVENTICASGLIKIGATSKNGLVPATEVLEEIDGGVDAEIPVWVRAWIEAEGLRPWPES
jgi:acyl-CoA thioesterase FadM